MKLKIQDSIFMLLLKLSASLLWRLGIKTLQRRICDLNLVHTFFIPPVLRKFSAKVFVFCAEAMQMSIQSWNIRISTFLIVGVFV